MTKNVIKLNKKIDKINNNVIRKIYKYLEHFIDFQILNLGNYSMFFHYIFMFLVLFILIFNNNIFHLIILLIIVFLDGFSIIILNGCPLTHLERKYLKKTTGKITSNIFKKAGILHNCNHEYEKQLELVTYCSLIIALKCLFIIFFKTFNVKLFNHNSFYL